MKFYSLRLYACCDNLPLFSICITVAVVLGVRAVPVDATGTFLDAGPRAAPVEMLLAGSAYPPCVGGPIWRSNTDINKHVSTFKQKTASVHSQRAQLFLKYQKVV